MSASNVLETTGLCGERKSNPSTQVWRPIQLWTSVFNFSELTRTGVSHLPCLLFFLYHCLLKQEEEERVGGGVQSSPKK